MGTVLVSVSLSFNNNIILNTRLYWIILEAERGSYGAAIVGRSHE